MAAIPTGTITFLFTDIENSTKLWQEQPERMKANLARHDALLRAAIERHEGYIFKTVGDAFCAAFPTALQGVKAAGESQQALAQIDWGDAVIKVRMGLHTGDAEERDNDYFGNTLNRVARLMSVGHGGQILFSLATQELVRDKLPEGATLLDLGECRLKDLIRPERIFQLNIAGLPTSFAPLKTLDVYRHNLPTQLTSFIGREKEMAEIKQALAEHRLVTLTGSGGAGKTRLSLQVAADLLDQFPSGMWFVELAPLADPDLIPQTILTAADIQAQQGTSALENLTDFLREKTSLLVLDNCEHLIDACARLADTLLSAAPNLKILASSREALGVKGEQSLRVPSLSAPDIKHLPQFEQLSQYEAVRLFIDRARLAQPHFVVTNENAPAVAQICHRLDGIPLAIELAAARLRMLSAEQIAARLDDRFRLLTGGSRTALPRQQTLRALIDWSYDLLSENERTLLRRLAVFSGGCTLEGAEQVCSDDNIHVEDILDLLTHLVDKSLVNFEEQSGDIRYRILETVRQFAREKLTEHGESEKVRARHLDYYLKYAEEAEPHLFREEQIVWLNRLEAEHDNFRAALEWIIDNQEEDRPEAGLRLTNALWRFWFIRGYWLEGYEWFMRALKINGTPEPTIARARALGRFGLFMDLQGDRKQAIKLLGESAVMCRELNDKPGLAYALLNQGRYIFLHNDLSTGKALLAEGLSIYKNLDDKWGIASALYALGQISSLEFDYSAARQYYDESLQAYKEIGDRRGIAYSINNLGLVASFQGDWAEAQAFFEKSLSLSRELGDKPAISMWLANIGSMVLAQGDFHQAEKLWQESLAISQDIGNKEVVASAQAALGVVARYQNNYEQALKMQFESLAYFRSIADKSGAVSALTCLSELFRLKGDYNKALSYCIEGLSMVSEVAFKSEIAYLLEETAALSMTHQHLIRGMTLFGAAEALFEAIHFIPLPIQRAEFERNKTSARAQLDQASFNAAYSEGRAMSMEQAVAYALETLKE